MKKLKIRVWMIIAVLLVVWGSYSLNQPPILIGVSNKGEWKVEFTPSPQAGREDQWASSFQWNKEAQPTVKKISWLENNEVMSESTPEDDDLTAIQDLSVGNTPPNDSIDYITKIHWFDQGQEHEESITLKKHRRLFVAPQFVETMWKKAQLTLIWR
ncbi:hypothetical protein A374_18049 [Fictibacillus macauensis ZFHKF-1]|uniref:Uncharacterized protein n=1 Tax=Fictibacillus macauensis ZFHKF-1 TaxID=1196324 RepID=I8UB18_9BACL|nr:hypothetical protein [Fictibacillus macauensis]EIT83963.1 hypothetical protein A374_18049 [Fictibacillus macauensis ZFHKF-1]